MPAMTFIVANYKGEQLFYYEGAILDSIDCDWIDSGKEYGSPRETPFTVAHGSRTLRKGVVFYLGGHGDGMYFSDEKRSQESWQSFLRATDFQLGDRIVFEEDNLKVLTKAELIRNYAFSKVMSEKLAEKKPDLTISELLSSGLKAPEIIAAPPDVLRWH